MNDPAEARHRGTGGTSLVWSVAVLAAALFLLEPWGVPAPAPGSPPGWLTLGRGSPFRALQIEGNHLWAGGRDGLVVVDWRTGSELPLPSGTPGLTGIETLALDASGTLWVGHDLGLTARTGGTWESQPGGITPAKVLSLYIASNNTLWAGTWVGAARRDPAGWTFLTPDDGLPHERIRTIFEDSRGGLWFGSYAAPAGGLVRMDDSGAATLFTPPDRLPHANVVAIAEDRYHRIWVGTGFFDRGGLTRIEGWASGTPVCTTFGKSDGLAGQKCRSIFETDDGTLWFGSEMDGLTRFDGASFTVLTTRDGLGGNEVMQLLQDPDRNLWMATSNGITRLASTSPRLGPPLPRDRGN
ncbi:MAG TPA: two-component regulator propeller domain-containing protein [Candidatus Ozemobacteraceae bacterium]|nr:two-component regulator propeller domain-containing protein [Candidatus Ozemobacteraceae bacterium]